MCLRAQAPNPQAPPPYFDEPNFIVAGVADPSARGGHGSDPVLRSAEALAKATAALRHRAAASDTNPLEAVRAYQRAADLDPSEPNLFNWGAELLTHRASDQAVEVFADGHRLFPRSTRTLLGLAVALYSRGSYDQAAQRFFEAADLDASDPAPYLFLGKISSPPSRTWPATPNVCSASHGFTPKTLGELLLCGHTDVGSAPSQAQALLDKAVRLDPQLGEAFLLLGILNADAQNLPSAISAYQNAIRVSPGMEEAHYRLAMAYRRTGKADQAQKELELYQQLPKQSAEALERERSQIQQFVFDLKLKASSV